MSDKEQSGHYWVTVSPNDLSSASAAQRLCETVHLNMTRGVAAYIKFYGSKGEDLVTRVIPHQCELFVNDESGTNRRRTAMMIEYVRFKVPAGMSLVEYNKQPY
ncbi:hypothetical protein vBPaeMP1420_83 [Pseudomonas phage vB_PaeM_P1420]|nr:hypothetical protein vBPaeMP1420_83 [Pseudomonas phage vB_PaeM_P1420]